MKHECQWSLVALHIVRTYNCVLCGNQITRKRTIKVVTSFAQLAVDCKQWECFQSKGCKTLFGLRHSLTVHKRVHTGSKPYSCVLCNHRFFTFAGLGLHKKVNCAGEIYTVMKTRNKVVSVPVTRSRSNTVVKDSEHSGKVSKASVSKWKKQKRIQTVITGYSRDKKVPKKTVHNSLLESTPNPNNKNNIEVEEDGVENESNQNHLHKQTLLSDKDISSLVQTASGYLSQSDVSQVEQLTNDVKTNDIKRHQSKSQCQISKNSFQQELSEVSPENVVSCSDTDLTASKKLKALTYLTYHSKQDDEDCLPVSTPLNCGQTTDANETLIESNEEPQDSPVSDISEYFDSEDHDLEVEDFPVCSKDHKYNTRTIDPKKSYKKHLPKLKNKQTKVKVHTCSQCPRSFATKEGLQTHLSEHKQKVAKQYQCDTCQKLFHNKSKMEIHRQIHSEYKPYSCLDCEMSFSSKEKWNVHNRIHSGEKPYRCDCCPKEFRCRTYLKQHIQVHRSSKDYRCSVCDKGFHMEKYLRSHMANAQMQICHICKKSFCSAPQLNAHVKGHGEDYPYPCELCKKRFKVQNNYLLHCAIQHNIGDTPPLRKFPCELCPSSFHKLRQMAIHMENVHSKSKATLVQICPWSHCGRKFTSEKRLNIHVRSHNGEKSYLCYKCGVNFKDYVYYRKHRARCLQKRKGAFACDICGTVLTEMGSLRVHKRIHTGEKPYRCDICGTWFRTPSHLNRHRRIHLRIKEKSVRRAPKIEVMQETSFTDTFVLKTEKEDVDDAIPVVTAEPRYQDQPEFVESRESGEIEDRKPVFDNSAVQTMSTSDVNEFLFASQIVQEVMATSHIKKEPNETHYIVISQDPDPNESQQFTYITREQHGISPDGQITYITQGQDTISDEQVTFITQGQEFISSDGQITYVTEAQDTGPSDHANPECIGDIQEIQCTPVHNDDITFTITTSNEDDHTRYIVVNPDIHA